MASVGQKTSCKWEAITPLSRVISPAAGPKPSRGACCWDSDLFPLRGPWQLLGVTCYGSTTFWVPRVVNLLRILFWLEILSKLMMVASNAPNLFHLDVAPPKHWHNGFLRLWIWSSIQSSLFGIQDKSNHRWQESFSSGFWRTLLWVPQRISGPRTALWFFPWIDHLITAFIG